MKNISDAKRQVQDMKEGASTSKLFKCNKTNVEVATVLLGNTRKDLQPKVDSLTAFQETLSAAIRKNSDIQRKASNKGIAAMIYPKPFASG